MKKARFLMSRTSIIVESWWVDADSEDEAMQLAMDGEADNGEPYRREWLDYYDDEWTIDDKESRDDLVLFIKSKEIT